MEWNWHQNSPSEPLAGEAVEELRLFPVVGADLCYSVTALLACGRLEEAAALVSDRAWVASPPLYG
jgi:hypothetical protein